MRGFRPSHFTTAEDLDEEGERIRQENLLVYETLAKLGKPLFDLDDGTEHRDQQEQVAL